MSSDRKGSNVTKLSMRGKRRGERLPARIKVYLSSMGKDGGHGGAYHQPGSEKR